jgi:hypothetical protein
MAALAFGLAPAARAAAANVVPNSGFEQGGCGNTPAICGWEAADIPDSYMYQDGGVSHSGSASMSLEWETTDTGGAFLEWWGTQAFTDAAFCAPIAPGVHAASFWYDADAGEQVSLDATFYQGVDCTGSNSYDSTGSAVSDAGWQQSTGALTAPPGTQSARFSVTALTRCDNYSGCSAASYFDDLDVESDASSDISPPDTTITSGPSGPSNSASAAFGFTAGEPSTFECSLDGGAFTACASPATYTGLGNGTHTFRVRATDAAGNTGPSAVSTFTVDKKPPNSVITSGPSGPTKNASPTFAFSGSDDLTGVANLRYSYKLDDGQWSGFGSATSTTLGGGAGLADGSHAFYVKARDEAGNEDPTPASRTFVVDTVAPRGTVVINGGASRTRSQSVMLSLSASDPSPGTGVTQMRIANSQTELASASWTAYATTRSWTLTSGTGTKTVYVRYRDGASNVSPVTLGSITYRP